MNLNEKLELMIRTAKGAGELALKHQQRLEDMPVSFKGQADLLCDADEDVEAFIFNELTSAYPNIAFIGEEGGLRGDDTPIKWVVDPIDGTTNYLSGLPFSISIALVEGTTPLAGVVYSPTANEMFSAIENGGAFLNGDSLTVNRQTNPARFVLGTGLPIDAYPFSANAYQRLHDIREEVAALRIIGSCALSLAYVACGRLHGYFEGPTGFLDAAAGLIIVKEAGGTVSDFWGTDEYPSNYSFVAGDKTCHDFMLETTRKAPR